MQHYISLLSTILKPFVSPINLQTRVFEILYADLWLRITIELY